MLHYDVIVIGLGAMGSAACYELARRGWRVLGLDRHPFGHTLGSSHGSSRIIRACYAEHPHYVPLVRRAYQRWDELVRVARLPAEHLFKRTGGLYLGLPTSGFITGSILAAKQHHLDLETLSRSDLAARFPQFHVDDSFVGLFEPDAGYVVPEAVLTTYQRLAREAGATLRDRAFVSDWKVAKHGIEFETLDKVITSADRLVVTTGAWAGELLASAGVRITPTRQVLGWVQPRRPEFFAPGVLPIWAIDASHLDEGLYYGFPTLTGPHQRPGLKIARHAPGTPQDMSDLSREYQAFDEQTFRPCLTRWMPDADGPTLSTATCIYENSPDQHFIIDRHPQCDRILLACGFSGHGFKFASVIGEILAELAIDGRTHHPIDFLSLARFAGATP